MNPSLNDGKAKDTQQLERQNSSEETGLIVTWAITIVTVVSFKIRLTNQDVMLVKEKQVFEQDLGEPNNVSYFVTLGKLELSNPVKL